MPHKRPLLPLRTTPRPAPRHANLRLAGEQPGRANCPGAAADPGRADGQCFPILPARPRAGTGIPATLLHGWPAALARSLLSAEVGHGYNQGFRLLLEPAANDVLCRRRRHSPAAQAAWAGARFRHVGHHCHRRPRAIQRRLQLRLSRRRTDSRRRDAGRLLSGRRGLLANCHRGRYRGRSRYFHELGGRVRQSVLALQQLWGR